MLKKSTGATDARVLDVSDHGESCLHEIRQLT